MEATRLGTIVQTWANVGILVSLILDGVQLHQNSELMRLAAFSNEVDGEVSMRIALAGEMLPVAWSKAISAPETMTLEEILQVDSFLFAVLKHLQRRHYLHQEGLWENSAVDRAPRYLPQYFSNAYAQHWWQSNKDTVLMDWYYPDFFEHIDAVITTMDPEAKVKNLMNLQRELYSRAEISGI